MNINNVYFLVSSIYKQILFLMVNFIIIIIKFHLTFYSSHYFYPALF